MTDFTDDKAVLVGNVCQVLINALEKIKISMILPYFLKNFLDLYLYLEDTPYKQCIELTKKFFKTKVNKLIILKINIFTYIFLYYLERVSK